MIKDRIDIVLVKLRLSKSRTYSKELIKQGRVFYKDKVVNKPSLLVEEEFVTVVEGKDYVSRGAYKLLKALDNFNIDVEDRTCLDIGSSTGGFTQVLLERGASKVYAVDVGTDQLDNLIRNDKRVIVMENTNIKDIDIGSFQKLNFDIITIDVSFISIVKILDILWEISNQKVNIITLIKPQFEGSTETINKGIVNRKFHYRILKDILEEIYKMGFSIEHMDYSPIRGKNGNVEYLVNLKKCESSNIFTDDNITNVVEKAFNSKEL